MRPPDGAAFEEFRRRVVGIVRESMADRLTGVDETTELTTLRGFDSLTIVRIIERVEALLGREIDPAVIVPETFASAGTLARVAWAASEPADG